MLETYYRDTARSVVYTHIRDEKPVHADFHLHDQFEIYFFLSGDVNYFIEKKMYTLQYGDLLIMNGHEIHKPSFFTDAPYERIVLQFDAAIAEALNSPSFNLLSCFVDRPSGEKNRLSLGRKQCEEILRLFDRIEDFGRDTSNGSDVMKLACFLELLVYINRVFSSTLPQEAAQVKVPEKLTPVLEYIDSNLDSDLTLEFLEHHFFINRFHLTRLFKKTTNSSLHEYIMYKRISTARKLLSQGSGVTEACTKSGFNDYSNFLRRFKRAVGVSPGSYRKTFLQDRRDS